MLDSIIIVIGPLLCGIAMGWYKGYRHGYCDGFQNAKMEFGDPQTNFIDVKINDAD